MIDVSDLVVSLGGTPVLEDVDLHVDRGEFVGLVGPNGAGKTTLLLAINGSLSPDRGSITLDGSPLVDLSARETSRRVATVHQDTSVKFAFDVETIVSMGRTPHSSRLGSDPDGVEAVERALERTDVADLRDRRISDVSGGERQRVFLARALAQDAPSLLLDEPTANLDVNHAARTLSLVRDLVDDGKAAIGAIHDLDAAARYCDRLLLLNEGTVVDCGPPTDVLTEDAVSATFDTDNVVATNPATGTPTVTALPTPVADGRRVHVLGGGPTGARVIGDLWSRGHAVSAGPLPEGDAGESVARSLGVDVATVPRFEPIDDAMRAAAQRSIAESAVTVLVATDGVPALPLLSLAGDGASTVIVENEGQAVANGGSGRAERRYRSLRERSTVVRPAAVPTAVARAPTGQRVPTPTD